MYKDDYSSFGKTFLMGMDFDFMMLDVCTLTFIELVAIPDATIVSRICLGILVAFILDSFFIWLRGHTGRRNLSKHTLIDEAFFI